MDLKIDKSKWPRGEWDNEPDYLEWTDESTGFSCQILRDPKAGFLKGVVDVETLGRLFARNEKEILQVLDIGGMIEVEFYYYHIPNILRTQFRCWNYHDLIPSGNYWQSENATYKNIEYVKEGCRSICNDLSKIPLTVLKLEKSRLEELGELLEKLETSHSSSLAPVQIGLLGAISDIDTCINSLPHPYNTRERRK